MCQLGFLPVIFYLGRHSQAFILEPILDMLYNSLFVVVELINNVRCSFVVNDRDTIMLANGRDTIMLANDRDTIAL